MHAGIDRGVWWKHYGFSSKIGTAIQAVAGIKMHSREEFEGVKFGILLVRSKIPSCTAVQKLC